MADTSAAVQATWPRGAGVAMAFTGAFKRLQSQRAALPETGGLLETDCVFWDRSLMGVEQCPTGRFASAVPAVAAPSAASIVPCRIARHRTFALMLCYVSFFSND